jgi:hypothetical protein
MLICGLNAARALHAVLINGGDYILAGFDRLGIHRVVSGSVSSAQRGCSVVHCGACSCFAMLFSSLRLSCVPAPCAHFVSGFGCWLRSPPFGFPLMPAFQMRAHRCSAGDAVFRRASSPPTRLTTLSALAPPLL